MVVKKKKGRKPKNYYQNNVSATVASTSFSDGKSDFIFSFIRK